MYIAYSDNNNCDSDRLEKYCATLADNVPTILDWQFHTPSKFKIALMYSNSFLWN